MRIDWDISPNNLIAGDLSKIEQTAAPWIEHVAARPDVVALAGELNVEPVILIVGLVARAHASKSRSAARVAKAILGAQQSARVDALAFSLGLEVAGDSNLDKP